MAKTSETQINLRAVTYKGRVYLETHDVVDLLRDFGGTEETDVRRRVEELCCNILNMEKKS